MKKNKVIAASAISAGIGVAGVASGMSFANAATPTTTTHTTTAATSHALQAPKDFGGIRAQMDKKLAKELGVSTTQLDAAMKTIHQNDKAEHKEKMDDRRAAIAKDLGVSTAKLDAALKANRPAAGHRPNEAALAKSLGVTTQQLHAAFVKERPAPPKAGTRPAAHEKEFATDLAKALNISVTKVQTALKDTKATGGPMGGPMHGGFHQAPPPRR